MAGPTREMKDIYESLINTADKQVTLTLNSKPAAEGSWTTVVIPTASEQQLYYYNWVQKNIEKVTAATDGKVGYVHIPDMGAPGTERIREVLLSAVRQGRAHR